MGSYRTASKILSLSCKSRCFFDAALWMLNPRHCHLWSKMVAALKSHISYGPFTAAVAPFELAKNRALDGKVLNILKTASHLLLNCVCENFMRFGALERNKTT